MTDRDLNDFTVEDISKLMSEAVDAIIVVDGNADKGV